MRSRFCITAIYRRPLSRRFILLASAGYIAAVGCLLASHPVHAQEQSVKPGINESFESPNVDEWVERFEREGREVYDRRDQLVELTGLKPGMAVADVGSGTGLFTRLFAKAVGTEGKVFAVDISDEFVASIEDRAAKEGQTQIQGIICSADDTKLPPNSVDVVYICDTYHHFEFPHKTMASIFRALKPNGRVYIVDFKRIPGESSDWVLGHVRAGQDTVREEIEQVGFTLVKEPKEVLKDNYIMVFGKDSP